MKTRSERGSQGGADGSARRPRTKWPTDVMQAAAKMVIDQGLPATQVGQKLGIPTTTVSEWGRKYRDGGMQALEPKARGGAGIRRRGTSAARRDAVVAVKRAQPQSGSRRIRDVVKRFFGIGASETTVRRVLKQEGLARKREAPAPKPRREPKRFERAEPNQLWQSDLFTFLLRRHERVYVAAFMDDHSRYIVSLVMAHHQKSSLVMEALARGIADYGAPREILTDQGRQYTAWRGSTAFEEELRRNGIAQTRGLGAAPGHRAGASTARLLASDRRRLVLGGLRRLDRANWVARHTVGVGRKQRARTDKYRLPANERQQK